LTTLRITYPALPFLSECMGGVIAQILTRTHGVEYLRKEVLPEFQEALEFEIRSFDNFMSQMISYIRETLPQNINNMKEVPITVREQVNYFQNKISKELSKYKISIGQKAKKERMYEWFARELSNACARYFNTLIKSEKDFMDKFSSGWNIKMTPSSIEISPLHEEKPELNFPAIIRTTFLYEQARLFGMRDMKPKGSVTKGVFKLKCNTLWYLTMLFATISSIAANIRLTGRDRIYLCVGLNLHPAINYRSVSLQTLTNGINVIREVCSKYPFLEDVDLMKYIIIFNIYNEKAYIPEPAAYTVYAITPADSRFTLRFSFSISTEELGVLDKKLESLWGADKDDVVQALKEVGECLVRIYRIQALQQELPLDRLIITYKLLCYAATEPGYKSPSEFIYEFSRILADENTSSRLKRLLKKHLQDKYELPEKEADEKVKGIWGTLNKVSQII